MKTLINSPRRNAGFVLFAAAVMSVALFSPVFAGSGGTVTKKSLNKAQQTTLKKAKAASIPNDVVYAKQSVNVNDATTGSSIATCPGGYKVIGGGYAIADPGNTNLSFLRSGPSNGTAGQVGDTAWEVQLKNASGIVRSVRTYAVCLKVTKSSGITPGADILTG